MTYHLAVSQAHSGGCTGLVESSDQFSAGACPVSQPVFAGNTLGGG
jgi:hypothetical protein